MLEASSSFQVWGGLFKINVKSKRDEATSGPLTWWIPDSLSLSEPLLLSYRRSLCLVAIVSDNTINNNIWIIKVAIILEGAQVRPCLVTQQEWIILLRIIQSKEALFLI